MGKEGKPLSVSLPSVIIYRISFTGNGPRACNFSALAQRNHGISPTGASTDPWTASSRELHVQLLGKSRGGLPSFADLTRAPRPDPAGDGEQAAALRNMSLCYSALFPCRPVSLDLFLSSSTCFFYFYILVALLNDYTINL